MNPGHRSHALGGVFIGGIVEALFAIHNKAQPHCRMGQGHGRQGLPHASLLLAVISEMPHDGAECCDQIFCFNDRALRTRPRSNVAHATTFDADFSTFLASLH